LIWCIWCIFSLDLGPSGHNGEDPVQYCLYCDGVPNSPSEFQCERIYGATSILVGGHLHGLHLGAEGGGENGQVRPMESKTPSQIDVIIMFYFRTSMSSV
jgi:hypothetical protein